MSSALDYLNRLLGKSDTSENVPGIPEVPATEDRNLYSFLTAIKEWISQSTSTSLNRLVSWQDLTTVGLVEVDEDGNVTPGSGAVDCSASPPAPLSLTGTGAMSSILLEWTGTAYPCHGYAEIYACATDDLGQAVLVGTSPGTLFDHSVGAGQSRYYWVRFVNAAPEPVRGPWNASNGTLVSTSDDPAWVLSVLTGEITETQLFADLNDRIDLIDAPYTTSGSVDARIKAEETARTAGDDALALQISTLAVSGDPGFDSVLIWYFDTTVQSWTGNGTPTVTSGWIRPASDGSDPYLISPDSLGVDSVQYPEVKARLRKVGTQTWDGRLYYKRTGDTTWDVARSKTVSEPSWDGSGIASVVWDMSATWDGTIKQIRLDFSTSSDGSNYIEADWIACGRSAPGASTAQITNIEQAKIGYCTISGHATDHTDKTTCVAAGGTWNVGIPFASAVKQVNVSAGGQTVAVEAALDTHADDIGHLYGQYTVKIDNNGYVAGFGLANLGPTDGSQFTIVADKFSVINSSKLGSQVTPFVIGMVDGVSRVAITNAVIQDSAITNAKISNAAIDNAKISNVSASKLTAGSVGVSDYIQSTGYVAGSSGWRISGNGALEANTGTFRGALSGATGTFYGELVAATGTFQGNLSAADGTFKGQLLAATGSFSGQVTVGAGSSVNYTYVTGGPPTNADNTSNTLTSGVTITGGGIHMNGGGKLTIGKSGYADYTTNGVFLGVDGGQGKLYIGRSNSEYFYFDGTTFNTNAKIIPFLVSQKYFGYTNDTYIAIPRNQSYITIATVVVNNSSSSTNGAWASGVLTTSANIAGNGQASIYLYCDGQNLGEVARHYRQSDYGESFISEKFSPMTNCAHYVNAGTHTYELRMYGGEGTYAEGRSLLVYAQ